MILDVGCGYLKEHKRRKGIGIDLNKGSCNIIGDIHYLPFRDKSFSFVYVRNVLEHLSNPIKALKELERILQNKSKISITIPIFHNLLIDELLKILSDFPFRLKQTIRRLLKWRKYKRDKGFWHLNRIKPKHIAQIFLIKYLYDLKPKLILSYGLKGKMFKKLNIRLFSPLSDIYYIFAEKF